MAASKTKQKHQTPVITYFIIFILGFLTGVGFTVYKTTANPPETSAGGTQQISQDEKTKQALLQLEAEVTANPDNHQAWRNLGNLYFDNNQPEKAIGAYSKALELHAADADILTDLGVMYRRTKQPLKAIESFDKAIGMDPAHEPSRFNKGIVLLYDLNKPEDAVASWEQLLKINPQARAANGVSIRDFIENVKAQTSGNK